MSESLLVAAENGDAKTVDSLLRQGASADARGTKGLELFTALHYAACRGHLVVAERLIRAGGANVNARNKDQETPLHLATYGGYMNIVELLLDSGADVHASNGYKETALFYAARRGYGAVTRLLMRRGANPNHESRFGDTAIDDCSELRVKQIIEQWDAAKIDDDSSSGGGGDSSGSSGSSGSSSSSSSSSGSILAGYSTGLLGKLSTRVLEHVCGMLDVSGLGLVAQIDGRCHRVVESQTLWAALGVSRWELAVRASVKEAAGGFEMEPLVAYYRPSSGSRPGSRPASKEGAREKLENQASDILENALMEKGGSNSGGGGGGGGGNGVRGGSSGGGRQSDSRTMLGFSLDVFLD